MSEMRGLIVIGTFVAVTLLLIGLMPNEFYTSGEQRTIDVPDYFESSELINWNNTYTLNITFPPNIFQDYWGKEEFGHDMLFMADKLEKDISNFHGYKLFGVWTGGHKMEWINKNGISRGFYLYTSEIEDDWDSSTNLASYTVKCKHFWMRADFTYDTTLHDSVQDAFDSNGLYVFFGIEWDQKGTTWNSWSLISSVLFFKPIQGIPYIISAMLAVPLWLAVSYMAFIFALRIIGSVFGGGGA